MESFAKAAAAGVVVCVLAVLIKKYSKEQAMLLTLLTAVAVLFVFFGFVKAIRPVLEQLQDATGLNSALITPVYKCTLIALIGHFASAFCKDAQEGAIAESITALATAAGIYVCLPLVLAVLSLVRQMLGV